MLNPLVTNYVDITFNTMEREMKTTPGKVPKAMCAGPTSDEGWTPWRPIPSSVTDQNLDRLERITGIPFPPLYRDLLKFKHYLWLTELGVSFTENLPRKWLDKLLDGYYRSWPRERIIDIGLLPFGSETFMDAGPVCFDSRHRLPDGDCPVVFWDHEWVGTDKEIQLMFSSSRAMFECLTIAASSDINFSYHLGSSKDDSLLPRKRELITQFLGLDPGGAGGPGKSYWTGWGVLPIGE